MATETLRLVLDATNKGLVAGLKEGELATGALQTKTSLLQGALGKVGIASSDTGNLLKAGLVGGAALAGGAIAKFALDGVEKYRSLAEETRHLQMITKGTAEEASGLAFAFQRTGTDADAGGAAIGRLSQRIGQGTLDLGAFGVKVAENKDGTTDLYGTLENVAEKFRSLKDPTDQAALGMAAFGRGWQTLVPLLNQGKDGLKAINDIAKQQHLIFSQEDVDRGHALTLATRDLKTAITGVQIEAAKALTPIITTGTQALTSTIGAADDLTASVGGIGNAMKIGFDASPVGIFYKQVEGVGQILNGDVGKGLLNLVPLKGVFDDIFGNGDSINTFALNQEAANKSVQKVADLATQGKKGTQEYKDAVLAAASANRDLNSTQTDVNNSLKTTADRASEAANAMLGKWNADLSAANAAAKVTEAQNAYADALTKKGIGATFEAAQKERDYEAAILASVNANAAAAVQKLGPGASAQEQEKAKTDATIKSLQYYATVTNGPVRDAILEHLRQLGLIPTEKGTWIHVETGDAVRKVSDLLSMLGTVSRTHPNVGIGVNVPAGTKHYALDGTFLGYWAKGGVVPGPIGSFAGYAGLHGGETIVPPGKMWGGSSVTVNINAGTVIAQDDLVSQVEEAIRVRVRTDGPRGY